MTPKRPDYWAEAQRDIAAVHNIMGDHFQPPLALELARLLKLEDPAQAMKDVWELTSTSEAIQLLGKSPHDPKVSSLCLSILRQHVDARLENPSGEDEIVISID